LREKRGKKSSTSVRLQSRHDPPLSVPSDMATRRASCSRGQLTVEADGEPVRISICHCLASDGIDHIG
jgi:hypothetical protein